jgi:Leucine-rich repeat (LRR) protein
MWDALMLCPEITLIKGRKKMHEEMTTVQKIEAMIRAGNSNSDDWAEVFADVDPNNLGWITLSPTCLWDMTPEMESVLAAMPILSLRLEKSLTLRGIPPIDRIFPNLENLCFAGIFMGDHFEDNPLQRMGKLSQVEIRNSYIADGVLARILPPTLTSLFVSGGKPLSSIEFLDKLPKLEALDLQDNAIDDNTKWGRKLPKKLRFVTLSYNENLTRVPKVLGGKHRIWILDILHCGLTDDEPLNLGGRGKGMLVDMTGNEFCKTPQVTGVITTLHMNATHIRSLDAKKLPDTLVALRVNNGVLTEVRHLSRLSRLETLDLSGNRALGELPEGVTDLVMLQDLSMEGTSLRELPESIGRLLNLKRLYLDDNLLRSVPASLGAISLDYLSLAHNPIDPNDIPAWECAISVP